MHAPLVEKKDYLLSTVPFHFSKKQIAANGKYARQVALEKNKPLVLDFRKANLQFDDEDVKSFFVQYYDSKQALLKLVYVAHWFNPGSRYLKDIDREWFAKGISTAPFDSAHDIIRWIKEINLMRGKR